MTSTKRNEENKGDTRQPNEGEGNRSAARSYNAETERFAKSGKVEEKAKEARRAVEGSEGKDLQRAEDEGRRHSAGEDPALRRK